MKKFNLAALPLAVAGILTTGQAFAGTSACFEVYKGADELAVAAFDEIFTKASCIAEVDRVGATAIDLAPTDATTIAYELTGSLDLEFDDIDGTGVATGDDLLVVYIPTTDIPSGTLIEFELTNATFNNNADILHLVQVDTNDDTLFEAVASTDGDVDGETTITFLTKAGVTITAGTRLVLSRTADGVIADSDIEPMGINIASTGCTDPSSTATVTIKANSAITDGGTGFTIAGGKSESQLIADISAQFNPFATLASAEGEVNAESFDSDNVAVIARTEFVWDSTTNDSVVNADQLIAKTTFTDNIANLDRAVIIDNDDHLDTFTVASAAPGATVMLSLYDTQDGAGVVSDAISIDADDAVVMSAIEITAGAATTHNTDADDLFVGASNDVYYVLENTDPGNGVMNFNYTNEVNYTLNFDDATLLDHCAVSSKTHTVGVNGAVLKVPYTFDVKSNWVRITNEHSEIAEITLDIFDEHGNTATGVSVGSVGAQSSVVLLANKLIEMAETQKSYTTTDNRHTMTFTVTAPKDSVHGVSVQTIPGGVDRVMPVLDQNAWSQ